MRRGATLALLTLDTCYLAESCTANGACNYLVPAGGPALDERPDCDAVAVPVARQVRPQERHVVDLATLVDKWKEGRFSSASLL